MSLRRSRTPDLDNVLPLPLPRRPWAQIASSPLLLRVRAHMSAMAGYASMLENVSPRIQGEILAVMAQKSQELVSILQPITDRRRASAATIQDYRQVRLRARELLVEYRTLVERLNDQVQQAHQSIEGLGHPG